MVEATSSLPPRPNYVLITLARREARLAVKEQLAEALARVVQGETLTEIAKSYNVSHMTISRLAV